MDGTNPYDVLVVDTDDTDAPLDTDTPLDTDAPVATDVPLDTDTPDVAVGDDEAGCRCGMTQGRTPWPLWALVMSAVRRRPRCG